MVGFWVDPGWIEVVVRACGLGEGMCFLRVVDFGKYLLCIDHFFA